MTLFLTACLLAGIAGASGCASAPVRYHTLAAPVMASDVGTAPVGFLIEVLPVGVPEALDREQILIRQGASGLQVLQGERWGGALSEEIRTALSLQPAARFSTQDMAGMPGSGDQAIRHIKVQVRRFDAWPGDKVQLVADWSVGSGNPSVQRQVCHTNAETPVGSDFNSIVTGQQKLLLILAMSISNEVSHPERPC